MSTDQKSPFLLLFRESSDAPDRTPEEMQHIMGQWMAWIKRLRDEGQYVSGNRLEDAQKILRGKTIMDGPFAETKEVVSGLIVVLAGDLAHATMLAQGCPGLAYGNSVEVRPVIPSTA